MKRNVPEESQKSGGKGFPARESGEPPRNRQRTTPAAPRVTTSSASLTSNTMSASSSQKINEAKSLIKFLKDSLETKEMMAVHLSREHEIHPMFTYAAWDELVRDHPGFPAIGTISSPGDLPAAMAPSAHPGSSSLPGPMASFWTGMFLNANNTPSIQVSALLADHDQTQMPYFGVENTESFSLNMTPSTEQGILQHGQNFMEQQVLHSHNFLPGTSNFFPEQMINYGRGMVMGGNVLERVPGRASLIHSGILNNQNSSGFRAQNNSYRPTEQHWPGLAGNLQQGNRNLAQLPNPSQFDSRRPIFSSYSSNLGSNSSFPAPMSDFRRGRAMNAINANPALVDNSGSFSFNATPSTEQGIQRHGINIMEQQVPDSRVAGPAKPLQHRPVITYIHSPRPYEIQSHNFKEFVQRATGLQRYKDNPAPQVTQDKANILLPQHPNQFHFQTGSSSSSSVYHPPYGSSHQGNTNLLPLPNPSTTHNQIDSWSPIFSTHYTNPGSSSFFPPHTINYGRGRVMNAINAPPRQAFTTPVIPGPALVHNSESFSFNVNPSTEQGIQQQGQNLMDQHVLDSRATDEDQANEMTSARPGAARDSILEDKRRARQ